MVKVDDQWRPPSPAKIKNFLPNKKKCCKKDGHHSSFAIDCVRRTFWRFHPTPTLLFIGLTRPMTVPLRPRAAIPIGHASSPFSIPLLTFLELSFCRARPADGSKKSRISKARQGHRKLDGKKKRAAIGQQSTPLVHYSNVTTNANSKCKDNAEKANKRVFQLPEQSVAIIRHDDFFFC